VNRAAGIYLGAALQIGDETGHPDGSCCTPQPALAETPRPTPITGDFAIIAQVA
jgi:hypothetical protein